MCVLCCSGVFTTKYRRGGGERETGKATTNTELTRTRRAGQTAKADRVWFDLVFDGVFLRSGGVDKTCHSETPLTVTCKKSSSIRFL